MLVQVAREGQGDCRSLAIVFWLLWEVPDLWHCEYKDTNGSARDRNRCRKGTLSTRDMISVGKSLT